MRLLSYNDVQFGLSCSLLVAADDDLKSEMKCDFVLITTKVLRNLSTATGRSPGVVVEKIEPTEPRAEVRSYLHGVGLMLSQTGLMGFKKAVFIPNQPLLEADEVRRSIGV